MSSGNFIDADQETAGNLVLRVKEGYSHDSLASMEYTYNGLLWLWRNENA